MVEDVPSSMDEATHILKSGQQIIRFSNSDDNNFNHSLFSFLAKKYNQTEAEAENKFAALMTRLKNHLQENDLVLPALGTLKKIGNDEKIVFVSQQKNINRLFPLIGLPGELKVSAQKKEEPVIAPPPQAIIPPPTIVSQQPMEEKLMPVKEEETVVLNKKRKDSWWMYAIVLMLLAAAGLLYYYLYYQAG
jgi:hypothetical protein